MLLRIVVAAVLTAVLALLPDVSILPLGGVAHPHQIPRGPGHTLRRQAAGPVRGISERYVALLGGDGQELYGL